MPSVADFTIIHADPFTLNPAGPIALGGQFILPPDLDLDARSILVYQVEFAGVVGAVTWGFEINGARIEAHSLVGQAFRTMHEIVQANVLQVGVNNIVFRVDPNVGAGNLIFSDVYLLWR